MKKSPPAISVPRARELRRNPTDAERAMWDLLRQHFPHLRFRRQVPLRHYIADFASHATRIIIEIDGGQHSPAADAHRTRTIEAEGYRIIRFWNNDVLGNPEGCSLMIAKCVARSHPNPASTRRQAAKSSHPSPIEGEGK